MGHEVALAHRHGRRIHSQPHRGPHGHLRLPSTTAAHVHDHRDHLRAGRRFGSTALIADGNHARVDGYASLTWDSWNTVRHAEIHADHVDEGGHHPHD